MSIRLRHSPRWALLTAILTLLPFSEAAAWEPPWSNWGTPNEINDEIKRGVQNNAQNQALAGQVRGFFAWGYDHASINQEHCTMLNVHLANLTKDRNLSIKNYFKDGLCMIIAGVGNTNSNRSNPQFLQQMYGPVPGGYSVTEKMTEVSKCTSSLIERQCTTGSFYSDPYFRNAVTNDASVAGVCVGYKCMEPLGGEVIKMSGGKLAYIDNSHRAWVVSQDVASSCSIRTIPPRLIDADEEKRVLIVPQPLSNAKECESVVTGKPFITFKPLKITGATYGYSCVRSGRVRPELVQNNLLDHIQKTCAKQDRCSYLVDLANLSGKADPVPGCAKDFLINLECPLGNKDISIEAEALGKRVTVGCDRSVTGTPIGPQITQAQYDEKVKADADAKADAKAAADALAAAQKLRVVSATYYANLAIEETRHGYDVKQDVEAKCKEQGCSYKIDFSKKNPTPSWRMLGWGPAVPNYWFTTFEVVLDCPQGHLIFQQGGESDPSYDANDTSIELSCKNKKGLLLNQMSPAKQVKYRWPLKAPGNFKK